MDGFPAFSLWIYWFPASIALVLGLLEAEQAGFDDWFGQKRKSMQKVAVVRAFVPIYNIVIAVVMLLQILVGGGKRK